MAGIGEGACSADILAILKQQASALEHLVALNNGMSPHSKQCLAAA